jgi:hypothetical protein
MAMILLTPLRRKALRLPSSLVGAHLMRCHVSRLMTRLRRWLFSVVPCKISYVHNPYNTLLVSLVLLAKQQRRTLFVLFCRWASLPSMHLRHRSTTTSECPSQLQMHQMMLRHLSLRWECVAFTKLTGSVESLRRTLALSQMSVTPTAIVSAAPMVLRLQRVN